MVCTFKSHDYCITPLHILFATEMLADNTIQRRKLCIFLSLASCRCPLSILLGNERHLHNNTQLDKSCNLLCLYHYRSQLSTLSGLLMILGICSQKDTLDIHLSHLDYNCHRHMYLVPQS